MLRIYLDNCCFNRPYDDQESLPIRIETEVKLEIQSQICVGAIELVWSYILDFENAQNPHEERREEISEWESIAKINVKVSEQLLVRMRHFEKQGIKSTDALHISCSIEAGCDYFITVDKGILKKRDLIKEILIKNPLEFFEELEEK